jgi:hypothetical protein
MNELKISYAIKDQGFILKVNKGRLPIKYPNDVWSKFPSKIKKSMVENFSFLATLSMPTLSGTKAIDYDFNSPLLGSFFMKPILFYIPSGAEEYDKDSFGLLRKLMNTTYRFKSYNVKINDYTPNVGNGAVILFTFGKDSMLSFALAEEIGLKPRLMYVEEPDVQYKDPLTKKIEHTYENKHKYELIKRFSSEFKIDVHRIKNSLGLARTSDFFGTTEAELPWGSQLTEYALLSLPFNHYFKARYIIYGNEASCSEAYMNKDDFMTYPVFDQSREWTLEITKLLKLLTKKISAISLLEPIHELAITSILHTRYPHYAKYQMSCFADSNDAKDSRWCHNCSKCARMFIFLKANGIDPKVVGFREDMLTKKKMGNYSLFGVDMGKPYDISGLGRDEQLLAFYLAYMRDKKGYLMKLFEKTLLKEAKKKFRRLFNTFYGIHDSITLPNYIRKKLIKIYSEELKAKRKEIMRLWNSQ